MAQYATHDGGGRSQSMPFGYDANWLAEQQNQITFGLPNNSPFGHQPHHQQHHQNAVGSSSILNQNDNSLLGNFFSNPDITNQMAFNFDAMGGNGDGEDSKADTSNGLFDLDGSGLIDDPFAVEDANYRGDFNTQTETSDNQQQNINSQMSAIHELHEEEDGARGGEGNTETMAAQNLMGMSNNRPAPAQLVFGNMNGSSAGQNWGGMSMNSPYMAMQTPHATGRQSTSAGSQNHMGGNQGQAPGGPFGYGIGNAQYQNPQNFQMNMQIPQQAYAGQRGRPHSMGDIHMGGMTHYSQTEPRSAQLPNNAFTNFSGNNNNNNNSYDNSSRPPFRFGSDEGFTTDTYRPPSAYDPSDEKATNLNQVPLADEASANGRARQPPMMQPNPRMLQTHSQSHPSQGINTPISQPSTPTFFNNNNNSYQSTYGGIPSTPNGTVSIAGASQFEAMGARPFMGHGHPPPTYPQPMQPFHATTKTEEVSDDEDEDGSEKSSDEQSSGDEQTAAPVQQPPRKRRKSDYERSAEDEYQPPNRGNRHVNNSTRADSPDEDTYRPDPNTGKKRVRAAPDKRKSNSSGSDPASPGPRRGSMVGNRKRQSGSMQSRVNLTEEQRRQNHIKSEKNRRDLIKTNYTELNELVPALKGGKSGLSKSEVLNEICDFIEELMEANLFMEDLLLNWEPDYMHDDGTYDDDFSSDDGGAGAAGGLSSHVPVYG